MAGTLLPNEWAVSDQWLQLVFDCADGSALAELERQCRLYDMTNTGTIAAPELRMALRTTLSSDVRGTGPLGGGLVPMNNMMTNNMMTNNMVTGT
jgi:hypothetical protein